MPELPQVDANRADRGLQTNNVGMEAFAQEGRRVGAFYHQIGEETGANVKDLGDQWQAHITFQQQAQGLASAATIHNQHVQALDQMLKDPSIDKSDPTIITEAMKAYDADNEQWAKGFTTEKGQEWATEYAARQRDDFQHYAIGSISHAVGQATLDNVDRGAGQAAQAAYTDPASAITTAQRFQDGATGMLASGAIDAETAGQIHPHINERAQGIALSGAIGAMDKADDPVVALHTYMAQPGAQELIGTKIDTLEEYARRQQAARKEDALHADAAVEKKSKDDFNTAVTQLETSMYVSDGHGGVNIVPPPNFASRLAQLSGMPGAQYFPGRLQSLGEAAVKATQDAKDGKDITTDAATYGWFAGNLGKYSKDDVDRAYNSGKLSVHDYTTFRAQAKDADDANNPDTKAYTYMNSYLDPLKSQFGRVPDPDDPTQTDPSPEAGARYAVFLRAARQTYDKARKLAPNADPKAIVDAMFNAGNPNSFINQIGHFKTGDIQQVARGYDLGIAGQSVQPQGITVTKVPPRQPGESASAYLARTGGQ